VVVVLSLEFFVLITFSKYLNFSISQPIVIRLWLLNGDDCLQKVPLKQVEMYCGARRVCATIACTYAVPVAACYFFIFNRPMALLLVIM